MKGIMMRSFAVAAGFTYFLPVMPTIFLKTTKPSKEIMQVSFFVLGFIYKDKIIDILHKRLRRGKTENL